MAEEFKAPKTTIEQDAPQEPVQPAPAPAPAPAAPQGEPFSMEKTADRAKSWFKRTFPGHENAVIFGLIGLVAAILIFVIGIWRALIVTLFVVVGVAIGQVVDGDPKILRALQRLMSDNRS